MDSMMRSRPLSILILLIAVAVQAIVPDTYDLVSIRGLMRVCMAVFHIDCCSDGCDSTEDVCGPLLSEITRLTRALSERMVETWPNAPGLTGVMAVPEGDRLSHLPIPILCRGDLVRSHVCLIC